MGGRGASIGIVKKITDKRVLSNVDYIVNRNRDLYLKKDIPIDDLGKEIILIENSYEEAVKQAVNYVPFFNDYYSNGYFLPSKGVEKFIGNNNPYALNNGYLGGFNKVKESKKFVWYQNTKDSKLFPKHYFKIEKKWYGEDKARLIEVKRQQIVPQIKTDALYRLGKAHGLKVTRKMRHGALKAAFTAHGDTRLIQKAKDGHYWNDWYKDDLFKKK